MTVPVISYIRMAKDGKMFEKDVETAFFLPADLQHCPPQSFDPDIRIVYRQPIRVVTRSEHHQSLISLILTVLGGG